MSYKLLSNVSVMPTLFRPLGAPLQFAKADFHPAYIAILHGQRRQASKRPRFVLIAS